MRCYSVLLIFMSLISSAESSKDQGTPDRRIKVQFESSQKKPSKPKSGMLNLITDEEISVANSDITDATLLLKLGDPRNSRLKKIDLSFTSITSTSFMKINQLCNLQVLALRAVNILSNELALLSGIKTLTSLDLSDCKLLRGDIAMAIRVHLGHLPLNILRLENLTEDCPIALEYFQPNKDDRKLLHLKHLSISGSHLEWEKLSRLPLSSFYAQNIKLLKRHVLHVNEIVTFTPRASPTATSKFYHLKDNSGDGYIAFHCNIREDEYVNLNEKTNNGSLVTKRVAALQIVHDYYNLSKDWISETCISRRVLSYTDNKPNYESISQLVLSHNNLNDKSISSLSGLCSLQVLHLNNNPLTAECLTYLCRLPLQELSLQQTFLKDDSDPLDDGLLGMQQKLVFPETIIRLLLDGTLIVGYCLPDIYKLPNLNTLSITRTTLNDKGIQNVYTCPRFIKLYVSKDINDKLSANNVLLKGLRQGAAAFKIK